MATASVGSHHSASLSIQISVQLDMLLSNGSLIKSMKIGRRTRIEAEIGHPIPHQGIQKPMTAATASLTATTVTPTAPTPQLQADGFTFTGSWAVTNPVSNLPRDYRHIIPRPMPMSASELPPLISLQTNDVPGPMVYRDWTIFDSGTRRHIMNAPESFVDFQSQHFVLHGDPSLAREQPESSLLVPKER